MGVVVSPQTMRQTNALEILRTVRWEGPIGRADIARRTGLSKPTVNAIVAELLARRYLREDEPKAGQPQRPGPQANILSFEARIGHVVGFDLGVSRLRVGLADLEGRILRTAEHGFESAIPDLDGFGDLSVRLAADLVREAGLTPRDVWAVGMGLPGFLDRSSGEIRLAPSFEHWRGPSFRDAMDMRFADAFGCDFLAGGRVQFAMLAEHRRGAARDVDDAVFVHLGKGIGLGILANGQVVHGAHGFAGELGSIDGDELDPPPPGVGPFEWAAGGRAFARLARRAVERGESPALAALCEGDPSRLEAPMVFAAAAEGDPAAAAIVDRLSERIARGLAAACCILNPAKLIIGAGLARAGDGFVGDIGRRIAALVPFPVQVERTTLLERTSVLGAVEQALKLVEEADFFLFDAQDQVSA